MKLKTLHSASTFTVTLHQHRGDERRTRCHLCRRNLRDSEYFTRTERTPQHPHGASTQDQHTNSCPRPRTRVRKTG